MLRPRRDQPKRRERQWDYGAGHDGGENGEPAALTRSITYRTRAVDARARAPRSAHYRHSTRTHAGTLFATDERRTANGSML